MSDACKQAPGVAPVITFDGPTGVGKSTLSAQVAHHVGWHFLASGCIYRLFAYLYDTYHDPGISLEQATASQLQALCDTFDWSIQGQEIWVDGRCVTDQLRQPEVAQRASYLSKYPQVRQVLLQAQLACRRLPGLVAEGRDMGSVVFPDACVAFFLDASLEVRAQRRLIQLTQTGAKHVPDLQALMTMIRKRDAQDSSRTESPLCVPQGSIRIDTTNMSYEAVWQQVMCAIRKYCK